LGQAYFTAGRCRQAVAMFERAIAQLTGPNPKAPTGTSVTSILLLCSMMKSAAHSMLGEPMAAETAQSRVQELADRSQRPFDRVAAGYSRGLILLHRGDLSQAKVVFDETLTLAREHEIRLFIPIVACHCGIANLELGLAEAARTSFAFALGEAEEVGHSSVVLRATHYLALSNCSLAEAPAALAKVRNVRDGARQQGYESLEAEALLSEARILMAQTPRQSEAVERCLQESIAIAIRLEAEPLLVKIQGRLARLGENANEGETANAQRGGLTTVEI